MLFSCRVHWPRFPEYIREFFKEMFPAGDYPDWAVRALKRVNVDLTAQ